MKGGGGSVDNLEINMHNSLDYKSVFERIINRTTTKIIYQCQSINGLLSNTNYPPPPPASENSVVNVPRGITTPNLYIV